VPSHEIHEKVGYMLGLRMEAIREANMRIDFPEKFPELALFGIKHDDDRLFAMEIIRGTLSSLHGGDGILAADLHYVLDYIDTWLDPEKTKNMLETMKNQLLSPRNRYGFVDPIRRLWSPTFKHGMLPITAYCAKCKGVNKPISSPFCNECYVNMFESQKIDEMPKRFLLLMLHKKMNERKIDPQIKGFVERNLSLFIGWIAEDRKVRGLRSLIVK